MNFRNVEKLVVVVNIAHNVLERVNELRVHVVYGSVID